QQQGGKFPDPIMALTFKYKDPAKPELDEIAQEINGFDLKTGKRMATFANLKDDGTTTAGDWIYTGSYPDSGNLMKRRNGIQDPTAWLPFIMTGEGVGRLFSTSMVDGPFPEHYEPVESPIKNPLHPAQSEDPVAFLYTGTTGKYGKVKESFGTAADYPYVATS